MIRTKTVAAKSFIGEIVDLEDEIDFDGPYYMFELHQNSEDDDPTVIVDEKLIEIIIKDWDRISYLQIEFTKYSETMMVPFNVCKEVVEYFSVS